MDNQAFKGTVEPRQVKEGQADVLLAIYISLHNDLCKIPFCMDTADSMTLQSR